MSARPCRASMYFSPMPSLLLLDHLLKEGEFSSSSRRRSKILINLLLEENISPSPSRFPSRRGDLAGREWLLLTPCVSSSFFLLGASGSFFPQSATTSFCSPRGAGGSLRSRGVTHQTSRKESKTIRKRQALLPPASLALGVLRCAASRRQRGRSI